MNYTQMKLYRVAWTEARAVLLAHGRTPAEAEEERFAIHEAVTGSRCSSKDLTNAQLTEVLIRFWAWSGGGLDKMLHRDRQPMIQARWLCRRIYALLYEIAPEENIREDQLDDHFDGIFKKLNKQPAEGSEFPPAPEFGTAHQWQKVIVSVSKRYDQLARAALGLKGDTRERFWPPAHALTMARIREHQAQTLSGGHLPSLPPAAQADVGPVHRPDGLSQPAGVTNHPQEAAMHRAGESPASQQQSSERANTAGEGVHSLSPVPSATTHDEAPF
jgi:hypothetical protein